MALSKAHKKSAPKSPESPILVVPKQTPADIARRVEIREALHDLKAKIVRGKAR